MVKIVLSGEEDELRSAITLLIGIHQLIGDRDIGQFVGEPSHFYAANQPIDLGIKVLFFNNKTPPFWVGDYQKCEIKIPAVSRSKFDWKIIKNAAGGNNGYMFGRYYTVAKLRLDDGQITQMKVFGNTPSESEEQLESMHSLSDSKILTITRGEEVKKYNRTKYKNLKKDGIRVYPTYLWIMNRQLVENELSKTLPKTKQTSSGIYANISKRIDLWTENKPINADDDIKDAIRRIN